MMMPAQWYSKPCAVYTQPTCPKPAGSVAQSGAGGAPPTALSPLTFQGFAQPSIRTSGTSVPSRLGVGPRPAVASCHARDITIGRAGREDVLHLTRRVGHLHVERRIARPVCRAVAGGRQAEQAPDPLHVLLAAPATELVVEADLVHRKAEHGGVSFDVVHRAPLAGTDDLMLVQEKDRHPCRSHQLVHLRPTAP